MASTDILSPRPVDMTPGGSLEVSALDQLCSGTLELLMSGEEASRASLSKPSAATSADTPADRSPGRAPTPVSEAQAAKLAAARAYVRKSWQYKGTGKASAAAVLASFHARHVPSGGARGLRAEAASLIERHQLDDTFYIYDLGNTARLMAAWRGAMPRVAPFYAVKCNPEPALLRLLYALGAGFDCASKAELECVLALGVPKERIIFAHPCKRATDLRYARDHAIKYTTFDTASELTKIAGGYSGVGCVLRIRCDDPDARVPLGLKYGADPSEGPALLAAARDLGLAVVGVSFHVGSGCKNLSTFTAAIAAARGIFDAGAALGHDMSLLDIGGGFSGRFDDHGHVMFGDIARTINAALAQYFPADGGVRVIAEPGRYFAETSAALFTPVYGKRDRPAAGEPGGVHKDYWLTDGLYGSFNCILYDDQKPIATVLRSPLLPEAPDSDATFSSTLWGPTCDSADFVYKDIQMPELRNGDWLAFPNTGAYTVAGACDFNGIEFTTPNKFYVFSDCAVDEPEPFEGSEDETEEADETEEEEEEEEE